MVVKRLAKKCQNLGEVEVTALRIEYDKFAGGSPRTTYWTIQPPVRVVKCLMPSLCF